MNCVMCHSKIITPLAKNYRYLICETCAEELKDNLGVSCQFCEQGYWIPKDMTAQFLEKSQKAKILLEIVRTINGNTIALISECPYCRNAKYGNS